MFKEHLYKCIEIIDKVRNTSSKNEKVKILQSTKGTDTEIMLKRVLVYTYHPDRTYKIGKARLKQIDQLPIIHTKTAYCDIFDLLDTLNEAQGMSDDLLASVYDFISNEPIKEVREFYANMIAKDMKAGFNISTVNKVWDKLIPVFKLQLARKYEDRMSKINDTIAITPKLDGVRGALIIKRDGTIEMRTRQNKIISGLNDIQNDVKQHMDLIGRGLLFDGELLYNGSEEMTSAERYRKTVEIVNSKDINKTNITFHIFDIVDVDEFYSEDCTWQYSYRLELLNKLSTIVDDSNVLATVPIWYVGGHTQKIVCYYLNYAMANNYEGVMINLCSKPYSNKRSNNLLKVKAMYTVDVPVVDIEQGTGKYKDMLGSVIIEYKGTHVNVGSGFSDEQRQLYWNNPDLILNHIIEVQYFEESKNKNNDNISLRFPVFKQIRDDKTLDDISYD